MILFDRKRALNQIMGSPERKVEGGEEKNPAHVIAQEAMNALEAKDAKGFAEATHALFMHYEGQSAEPKE